jgi:hypothetical protein
MATSVFDEGSPLLVSAIAMAPGRNVHAAPALTNIAEAKHQCTNRIFCFMVIAYQMTEQMKKDVANLK